jgi:hypothetical protein
MLSISNYLDELKEIINALDNFTNDCLQPNNIFQRHLLEAKNATKNIVLQMKCRAENDLKKIEEDKETISDLIYSINQKQKNNEKIHLDSLKENQNNYEKDFNEFEKKINKPLSDLKNQLKKLCCLYAGPIAVIISGILTLISKVEGFLGPCKAIVLKICGYTISLRDWSLYSSILSIGIATFLLVYHLINKNIENNETNQKLIDQLKHKINRIETVLTEIGKHFENFKRINLAILKESDLDHESEQQRVDKITGKCNKLLNELNEFEDNFKKFIKCCIEINRQL